jgi:hypothetical protein
MVTIKSIYSTDYNNFELNLQHLCDTIQLNYIKVCLDTLCQ